MLFALCHSDETGWVDVDDPAAISDLRGRSGTVVWGEADLHDVVPDDIAAMAEEFDLDRLAVEDALRPRQRPKFEAYDTHRFAVVHHLYEVDDHLEKRQISCFVGDDYMLVVHEGAAPVLAATKARLREPARRPSSPIHLLHALLDVVVDEYQALADVLEERIEALEERVVGEARRRVQAGSRIKMRRAEQDRVQIDLYAVKQQVARLRRYALPLERVLEGLVHASDDGAPRDGHKLLRDVHDHSLRITDQVRNIDDLAQAVLDLVRAVQSEELNEINKRFTGWAAIVAVPTVIAGIYGMNYDLVPSAGELFGFWFALLLMASSGALLYAYFKTRGWL